MADLNSALQSVLQAPGLQELVNQSITQQRQLAPLRTGVAQQAANMLPNSAFPGGRPNIAAVTPANYAAPTSSGTDWTKILSLLAAGAAGGGALAKLLGGAGGGSPSGAGGNLGNIVNALKKLFQRPQPGVQGNKPQPGGGVNPSNPFANGFTGFAGDDGYGMDQNRWPGFGDPTPNVDTSTTFNGIPGGYPDNPEDPSSIDPNWGGYGGGDSGGNWNP